MVFQLTKLIVQFVIVVMPEWRLLVVECRNDMLAIIATIFNLWAPGGRFGDHFHIKPQIAHQSLLSDPVGCERRVFRSFLDTIPKFDTQKKIFWIFTDQFVSYFLVLWCLKILIGLVFLVRKELLEIEWPLTFDILSSLQGFSTIKPPKTENPRKYFQN